MSPIKLEMPAGPVDVHRLVLDYTGTLSLDGELLPGVAERLERLASDLDIVVLTADTFGTVEDTMAGLPVEIRIIRDGREKADLIMGMEPEKTMAVGNGRNDVPMMEGAGLAVGVLGPEGAASELLRAADVVVRDIRDALDLLVHPLRLKATLRD